MKKFYLLAVLIFMFGCEDGTDPKKDGLEVKQKVSYDHIENYFIKDKNDVFSACEDIEEEILDSEHSGYEYSIPISNIKYTYNFKWAHSGEIMYVGFYCDFEITHFYPIFVQVTKEYSYRVGQYVMRKHYDGNRLKYLSFE